MKELNYSFVGKENEKLCKYTQKNLQTKWKIKKTQTESCAETDRVQFKEEENEYNWVQMNMKFYASLNAFSYFFENKTINA